MCACGCRYEAEFFQQQLDLETEKAGALSQARVLQVRRKVVVVSGRRQYLEMENDTYCGFMTERTAGEEEITLLGWIRTVYDIKDRTLDKFLASCTVYTPG